MKPITVAMVLLLALAAGAWFLVDSPGAPPPASAPAAGNAGAAPAPGVLDLPPDAPGASSGVENRETVLPAAAAAGAPPLVYAAPAPEGEGFLVRVVEAESKNAIPFAEVLFVDVGQMDEQALQARMAELHDIDALIEALAVRYRTDGAGTVRLPLPTQEMWAAARKEPWFGMTQERAIPAEGITIECRRSLAVAAQVVDAEGRPQAGIPVDLRRLGPDRSDRMFSLVTGADGIARFRRLEMFLRDLRGSARLALAIGGQLGVSVAQEFDPAALPELPLQLTLPPSGTLEVHLTGADGQPWTAPAMVQLILVPPIEQSEAELRVNRGEESNAFAVEGLARFTPVGLGMTFHALAQRPDGSMIGEAIGAGPAAAGGVVRLEIGERAGGSFVTGRILGENGRPVASTRLDHQIEQRGKGRDSSRGNNLRTDAGGMFRLPIENPELPDGIRRSLTVSLRQRGTSAMSVRADLSWSLPPGETNLGDLRLALAPLAAAGVVVDEAGLPVANAHVTMQQKMAYGTGAADFYWNWIQGGEAFTAEDGSFALHTEVEGAEFLVSCNSPELWCEGQVVPRGASGLQLVLRRGGSLAGQVLADEGAHFEDLYVELWQPEAPPDPYGQTRAPIEPTGEFAFRVLPPGIYGLRLRSNRSEHNYLDLQGFSVVAGAACADPRLQPLDARGQLRSLLLRVQNEEGKFLSQFSATVLKSGGENRHLYADDGELRLPLADGPVDLIVQCEGYLRARLQGVEGDQVLTLRRAPRVRIRITNPELVPAGYELLARVDAVADRELQIWSGSHGAMGPDGWAECAASALGASTVQLVLVERTATGTRGWGLNCDLGEIEVRDGGSQAFQVTLSAEEVAKTVERLRDNS